MLIYQILQHHLKTTPSYLTAATIIKLRKIMIIQ